MNKIIPVHLGNRSYDILIGRGLLSRVGAMVSTMQNTVRCAIITDENVAAFYLETLERSLQESGIKSVAILVKAGRLPNLFQCFRKLLMHCLTHDWSVMILFWHWGVGGW